MTRKPYLLTVGALLFGACYSGGDPLLGHLRSVSGSGPLIVWDLDARPIPEIPFPNDVATRPDLGSPTGRRINVSLRAPTDFETRLRQNVARLDGFGTFSPLWVRLVSPDAAQPELARLDLDVIAATQRGDTDFADDVILLINVTPSSPSYGAAQVLDFGNGYFPVVLENEANYFPNDPRRCASNLLFETYEEDVDRDGVLDVFEDTNQNGILDEGEDRDGDGRLDGDEDSDGDLRLDHPNLWATYRQDPALSDYDPCDVDDFRDYRDLITFYDLQTDTLWFRPVVPLEERTTYAVVLMRALVGTSGEPVQSPFPFVHHLQQTRALAPIFSDGLLQRYGHDPNDVAFAWTFTTQSVTATLTAVREGLHGHGALRYLQEEFPPDVTRILPLSYAKQGVEAYLLRPALVRDLIELVFENIPIPYLSTEGAPHLIDTYGAVEYLVMGDFTSPSFVDNPAGVFDVDPDTGRATFRDASVRFLLSVPKREYGTPPFPVALYCHGSYSLRLEALLVAGLLAKFGIATLSIDAYGNGLAIGGPEYQIIVSLLEQMGQTDLLAVFDAVKEGRARDLNNDGVYDPGGEAWTADMFHTRDVLRQTAIDYLQAVRVVQGFDGVRVWSSDLNGDGLVNDLAGDFDGDGIVDVGGPSMPLHIVGTSMGGLQASMVSAVEPDIITVTPISGGGGLMEIGLRTDLKEVITNIFLTLMGPMVSLRPTTGDARVTVLEWLVNDLNQERHVPFARVGRAVGGEVIDVLQPGDRIVVRNGRTGETRSLTVGDDRSGRIPIAANIDDPIIIEVVHPDGRVFKTVDTFELEVETFRGRSYEFGTPLVAIQEGLGYQRNTSAFRQLIGISQMVLDAADPINYVPRYHRPLAVRPKEPTPTNALFIVTMGDPAVPASAGVALARAAGVVDFTAADPSFGMSESEVLIRHHVLEAVDKLHYFRDDPCHFHAEAVNFDIDDLSDGRHEANLPRLQSIVRPPACGEPDPPVICATVCTPHAPLRLTSRDEAGIRAVRFPAFAAAGQHVISLPPNPTLTFDASTFTLNQLGLFHQSGGRQLFDHPCLASNDCAACAGQAGCPPLPKAPTLR